MGANAAAAPMPTRTATTKVSAKTTATFGNNNTALIDLFLGSQDVSDAVGRLMCSCFRSTDNQL